MASQRGHFFHTPSGTVDFLLSPPAVEIEGNILSIQFNSYSLKNHTIAIS
jgi:hypothetical protein